MITVYRWDAASQKGANSDPGVLRDRTIFDSEDVWWIDLAAPTEEEERQVFQSLYPVHPLTFEDITRLRREPKAPPHFPKVEEFKDYLFIVMNPPSADFLQALKQTPPVAHTGRSATQLSSVLARRVLITHHYEPIAGVDALHAFLARHETEAGRGPDFLFPIMLDASVDQYATALAGFDDALDALEARVVAQPRPALLRSLLRLKRDLVSLRKTLVHEREVMIRLARGEFHVIDAREIVYYRDVYDHIARFAELVDSSREMATDLMQTHLAATSNRLNEIMKVLTMISTILLPMTVIAGFYGMNFKMREYDWPHGELWALALMIATGVGSLAFFRWRRWI